MPEPNFPHRTLAVMDNLAFLRALDNDCIDLIAIDPPFAANETFTGKPRPPITDAERGEERALAARHDALNATRPNGTINLTQLELDHIQARKALDGVKGDDELYNLAILCAYCNRTKGNRLTLAQLREKNARDGVLYYVDHVRDLQPHEFEARRFAITKMREHDQRAGG